MFDVLSLVAAASGAVVLALFIRRRRGRLRGGHHGPPALGWTYTYSQFAGWWAIAISLVVQLLRSGSPGPLALLGVSALAVETIAMTALLLSEHRAHRSGSQAKSSPSCSRSISTSSTVHRKPTTARLKRPRTRSPASSPTARRR